MTSAGGSATFHLNIPPMPSGRFDPRDIQRLKEFGQALKDAFGTEKGVRKTVVKEKISDTQWILHVTLPEEETITYAELREPLCNGQRIERFRINFTDQNGEKWNLFDGTTVGSKRICKLWGPTKLTAFDIHIVSARDDVNDLKILLY